uniref:ATP synthase complex subunit 8 n=1 Tax=Panulirus argus TaxID=6737 RepID=A0A385LWD6_PANAR|nr:ATP synthase F0 subunit 8 [Panulirus argus]AYA51666.1 ATP synthase F0 subunit 8 [Panulirus argus]
MPQMGPMLWLNLFILFSFSLMCFIVLNYFILSPQKGVASSKQDQEKEKIWKW